MIIEIAYTYMIKPNDLANKHLIKQFTQTHP